MADTREEASLGISLDGSFAGDALKGASAADALAKAVNGIDTTSASAGLDKLRGSATGAAKALGDVKAPALVTGELSAQLALQGQIATFDAARVRKMAELKATLAALNKEATKGIGEAKEDPLEALRAASKKAAGRDASVIAARDAAKGAKGPGGSIEGLEKFLQNKMPSGLLGSPQQLGGFARLVQEAGALFGPGGADGVMKAGQFLSEAGPGLAVAGGAIAAGGAVIVA
ncbi:MAG: hypothetical protein ABI193_12725, partial [Minicystis sp.]